MMGAFLIMKLELVRGIPRFRGLSIMSARADQITRHSGKELFVDIYELSGDFDESEARMREHINQIPHLQWCEPLLYKRVQSVDRAKAEEENPLNIALEHMGEIP